MMDRNTLKSRLQSLGLYNFVRVLGGLISGGGNKSGIKKKLFRNKLITKRNSFHCKTTFKTLTLTVTGT